MVGTIAAAAYGDKSEREAGSSRPPSMAPADRPEPVPLLTLRFEGRRTGWLGAREKADGSKALMGAFAPCILVEAAAYGPSCRMKPAREFEVRLARSGGHPREEKGVRRTSAAIKTRDVEPVDQVEVVAALAPVLTRATAPRTPLARLELLRLQLVRLGFLARPRELGVVMRQGRQNLTNAVFSVVIIVVVVSVLERRARAVHPLR